jgi:hypothetical protein
MSEDYSLGYVRGFADTHGSLHTINARAPNHRAITFRSLDEVVLDELAKHLEVLGYEFKRYAQSPGDGVKTQHMVRIHKQAEVRRFCEEVGFRRTDRADRAAQFLKQCVWRRRGEYRCRVS